MAARTADLISAMLWVKTLAAVAFSAAVLSEWRVADVLSGRASQYRDFDRQQFEFWALTDGSSVLLDLSVEVVDDGVSF